MSDELLIRCCVPTLAAIQTGSLFNFSYGCEAELFEDLRGLNGCLRQKGVCAIPVRRQDHKALIYVYRPAMLARDLSDPLARQILQECGYPDANPTRCIAFLMGRLSSQQGFPHEIGLFLGYPAVDVRGFMEHKECKYTGLWKVYDSDAAEAQMIFQRCQRCTRAYLRRNQEGWSLSRLTIQPRQFSYNRQKEFERKVTA